MGAGGGGGSDGGGSGTRAPPTPRLSTFLRTFGTSASREARSGVDVDHETHARLAAEFANVIRNHSDVLPTSVLYQEHLERHKVRHFRQAFA